MGRRERNKEDKQRRLEEAGFRAFLDDGYAGASVERIAADADVARGTFYLYFRDKEALFVALMGRFFTPLLDAVARARDALAVCPDAASTYPVYGRLGQELAELLLAHRSAVRLYFQESRAVGAGGDHVRQATARLEGLTEEILADAVARGTLRPHDVHAAALAIVGGLERLTLAVMAGDARLDTASLAREMILLFRHGLAPPGAPR